jgi:carbamoyltransferase
MILGVNTSHDACFCILDDAGRPLYVLEEERFNRIKHSRFTTTISLEILLQNGLLDAEAVTDIVYSFEMDSQAEQELTKKCCDNVERDFGPSVLREVEKYFRVPQHRYSPTHGLGITTSFEQVVANLRIMFPRAAETSYMHHLCHAASAFYPSPFESAAVMVVDGSGRLETTTIWHGGKAGLERLKQIELPHSLGILYWLFSNFIGLDEGQTMGLAAYGQPVFRDFIYDRILSVDSNGDFSFKVPLVFWFDMDPEYAIEILQTLFGVKARFSQEEPLTQFHANIAASIQLVTEEVVLKLTSQARFLTGEKNLCLAGGVIQNCVANGRLVEEKIFENVWIQPMANDSGTALGAALQHYFQVNTSNVDKRWRMRTAQLGLGYESEQIKECLDRLNVTCEKSDSPAREAAEWISQGNIVGWMQGKPEVGPRALGGRSILADPRQRFNHFALNEIKDRQPWRPFAPSILGEYKDEYLSSATDSPYMILSFPLDKDACSRVPAICHVDGSARLQTVSLEDSAIYRELIERFHQFTGIPLILNTSFNRRAEPIVQHPLDAVRDFILTGLNRLMIDDWSVAEKPVVSALLLEALTHTRFLYLYEHYLRQCSTIRIIVHKDFTENQRRRRLHLEAILHWLKIDYKVVAASELSNKVSLLTASDQAD